MTIERSFFGHMLQGELLVPPNDVTVPIGTLRIWNNGASLEWVYRNNWEGLEIALNYAASIGADVIYVLAGEPSTQLPESGAWCAFVAEAVSRAAGRIKIWEPLNEAVYLNPRDPAHCLDLATMAHSIITSADKNAIVTTVSFNELLTDYGFAFMAQYLDLMAKRAPSAHRVAFHSYDPPSQIALIVSRIRQHTDLPLIDTETATPDLLSTFVNHAMVGVERVVWNSQERPAYLANAGQGVDYQHAYDLLTVPGSAVPMDPAPSERKGCSPFSFLHR